MKSIFPLIILCFLGFSVSIYGQIIYPVSAIAQSVPPHSGNLDELASPGANRIGLNLILHDATEISYQARLRISIEGEGISLTTRQNINPPPITLSFGVPTQLTGTDLAPYFDPNNLDFSGYSLDAYLQNGGLPNGHYNICFEVLDYDRSDEEAVALESCTSIFAILHDTPVVLAPIGAQTITYPQYLTLQWQARHTGAFPTAYEIEIYEYDPNSGLTPDLIIDYEQPFYEQTVVGITTAYLTSADPPLALGQHYFIRVGASDLTMMNNFKNNGWSNIVFFQYGESCPFPEGITAEVNSHESATINWQPVTGFNNEYALRYRQRDLEGANWYEEQVANPTATLQGLIDNTTYEYQLTTLCGGAVEGAYSPVDTLRTDTLAIPVDCSYDFQLPAITSTEPAEISIGDRIKIGGFEVLVTAKEASTTAPGAWNGAGRVRILWLAVWVNVYFEDIYVNPDGQIYEGDVIAPTQGLASIDGFVSPEEVYTNQQQLNAETNFCGVPVGEYDESDDEPVEEEETDPPFNGEGFIGGYIAEHNRIPPILGIGAIDLPFSMGSGNNLIAIDKMEFTTEGASLSAFASLDMSTSNGMGYMSFRADIAFHPGGFTEQPKLYLANNASFVVMEKAMLTLIAGENTYVSWDCQGVNAISIQGEVDFCKDLIIAADFESEELDTTQTVKGTFLTVMPEWKDFVAEISITPFALKQLPDWTWEVQTAVLDLSDVYTPDTVNFPEGYEHPDLIVEGGEGNGEEGNEGMPVDSIGAWKGFYLGAVTVKLPKKFSQREGMEEPASVTIGANDVIIDRTGFSGYIYGYDILSLEEGQMGTWAFSIDTLGIGLQSNQFTQADFYGKLVAPPFPVDTLGISALIMPDSGYVLTVEILEELSLDIWSASLSLAENSSITLDYLEEDDSYGATAVLHGSASLQPKIGNNNDPNADRVELVGVAFQDFTISSRGRFIQNVGSWALTSGAEDHMAGFPLVMHEIALIQDTSANEIILGLDASVNLTGSGGGEFSGRGVIRIVGEMTYNEVLERDFWKFKTVRVDALSVDVSTAGVAFHGAIQFYEEDDTYGRGYRGEVAATFQPGIAVAAVVQFGKKDDLRYFFVDALMAKDPGIPIGSSGLALYGFGGGAFYHMRREGFSQITLPDASDPGSSANMIEVVSELGASLSGTTYIPDANYLIGVKAMVAIGTIRRETFSGDATLEVTINAAGGLDAITFQGTGRFMTPVDGQGQPQGNPALTCELEIVYDHQNSSLHANLGVYVDHDPIVGGYDDNYAGTGVMHYDPDDWYIYLGVPETPMVLTMNVEGLDYIQPLDINMNGYFNMGSVLPAFPGLPSQVQDIVGQFNIVDRDDPRFANAQGVLFGANLEFDIPGLEFLMFYASFGAGAGFDMMLRHYEGGLCSFDAGNPNAPSPGINSWYGSGQMYAYIQGEIGIKITINYLFSSTTKRISILEIGAAAALQAQLPNPLWARGNVGGYFSVMGGLVSGNVNFKFEVGQKCDIWGTNPLVGIEFIGETSPDNNTNTDVDVFLKPQATFNIPIGEQIHMEDEDGNTHFYRSTLAEFSVKDANGSSIIGTEQWNGENNVVALRPEDVLPGTTELTLTVKLQFETKTPSTDWVTLTQGNGTAVEESRTVNFITGIPPNYVPVDNIAYSYPVNRQLNFHKSESDVGNIQLKQGQDYLFSDATYASKVRYIQNSTTIAQSDVVYNNQANRLSFPIASGGLDNSTITQAVILSIPTASEEAVDANVVGTTTELFTNQDQNAANPPEGEEPDFTQILMQQQEIESQAQALNEEVITTLNFRTSMFNTFSEKMNSLTVIQHWFYPILIDTTQNQGLSIDDLGLYLSANEGFDKYDMHGYFNGEEDVKPLIAMDADLAITGQDWYNTQVYPHMYQLLPTPQVQLSRRDPVVLGPVPVRALRTFQFEPYWEPELTDEDIATNSWNFPPQTVGMRYQLPYNMILDDFDYREQIAIEYYGQPIPPDLVDFYNGSFPYPQYGTYRFRLRYQLPGQDAGAVARELDIEYGNSN